MTSVGEHKDSKENSKQKEKIKINLNKFSVIFDDEYELTTEKNCCNDDNTHSKSNFYSIGKFINEELTTNKIDEHIIFEYIQNKIPNLKFLLFLENKSNLMKNSKPLIDSEKNEQSLKICKNEKIQKMFDFNNSNESSLSNKSTKFRNPKMELLNNSGKFSDKSQKFLPHHQIKLKNNLLDFMKRNFPANENNFQPDDTLESIYSKDINDYLHNALKSNEIPKLENKNSLIKEFDRDSNFTKTNFHIDIHTSNFIYQKQKEFLKKKRQRITQEKSVTVKQTDFSNETNFIQKEVNTKFVKVWDHNICLEVDGI